MLLISPMHYNFATKIVEWSDTIRLASLPRDLFAALVVLGGLAREVEAEQEKLCWLVDEVETPCSMPSV